MIAHPTMPAHPRPEITLVILRPALNPIIEQIRRARVIAIMSADAVTALEPTHPSTDIAVPAIVETSSAVGVEAVGHSLYGDAEAKVFAVWGDALLVGPASGGGVVDGSKVAFGERDGCGGGDEGGEEEDGVVHLNWVFWIQWVGFDDRLGSTNLVEVESGRVTFESCFVGIDLRWKTVTVELERRIEDNAMPCL